MLFSSLLDSRHWTLDTGASQARPVPSSHTEAQSSKSRQPRKKILEQKIPFRAYRDILHRTSHNSNIRGYRQEHQPRSIRDRIHLICIASLPSLLFFSLLALIKASAVPSDSNSDQTPETASLCADLGDLRDLAHRTLKLGLVPCSRERVRDVWCAGENKAVGTCADQVAAL